MKDLELIDGGTCMDVMDDTWFGEPCVTFEMEHTSVSLSTAQVRALAFWLHIWIGGLDD